MKYLYLTPFLFLASCSGLDHLSTAHDLEVKLNGSDGAYCVLSTPDNRYALVAPGKTLVERDDDVLTIDCKDSMSDRRRTMTIQPEFALGYWNYPKQVTIDFASAGQIDNGFRLLPTIESTEVLTEKSYSAPVDDTPKLNVQTYETMMQQDMFIEGLEPVNLNMSQETSPTLMRRGYDGRKSYPMTE